MSAARTLLVALVAAPLAACAIERSVAHGDAYVLPLPFAAAKDPRPSADPGVAPESSDEPLLADERHDVPYSPRIASGETGLLDVFTPPTPSGALRPAVMTLHGGAWRRGDKQQVRDVSRRFAREGVVAFAVNYSLAPRARWPGQLEDLQQGEHPSKVGAHVAFRVAASTGRPSGDRCMTRLMISSHLPAFR